MPGKVFMGEHELALGMTRYVLDHLNTDPVSPTVENPDVRPQ